MDCEEQNQGSTPAPEGREAVARALYLSMVREVFALSAASSTARPHAESIDGAAVRAIARGEAGDGLSRLAPAQPRCVDCTHGLTEGERCGGRAAFPCACVERK